MGRRPRSIKLHGPRGGAVHAGSGMVATSQVLAARAGIDMLRKGGNAVDAAVAAAACLAVTEPVSNGIGSDAFALVWRNGRLYGLNASGPSPALISAKKLLKLGVREMPRLGVLPVTVPGAPAAWALLNERFGSLPFPLIMSPAVRCAEAGFAVSPVTAYHWKRAFDSYKKELKSAPGREWFSHFAPAGRPPEAGEVFSSPDMAATLRRIAETGGRDFYEGDLAGKIDRFFRKNGGFLRKGDLAGFSPEWVEPLCVRYRDVDVWELPPNGQGLVALMALNLLNGFEPGKRPGAEFSHRQIEAIKLAFADCLEYVTDPRCMKTRPQDLLSETYAGERRKLIGKKALVPLPGNPAQRGGTVYLCAADGEGTMVSYIQSNYMGFGSGIVVPGTGISLQNRGVSFSLDLSRANCLEGGKRPYHTIIPGFVTKDNAAVGPFGVMGGFMQPQGHVQVISNVFDFGMDPQAALDAPRWCWTREKEVHAEPSFPAPMSADLKKRGHCMVENPEISKFGRGQIIWRNRDGSLTGGSDRRADGEAAGLTPR